MVFLRESRHIEMQPYNAEEFISMDELKGRIMEARAMKHKLRLDLMRETNRIDREELELFEYKLAKYMYELKAHAALNRHIDKAEALVTKFRNQKPPENATKEQEKEWERKKLTTKKSTRYHPQVHHLTKHRPAQGSGIGEDLLRLQAETVRPTPAG